MDKDALLKRLDDAAQTLLDDAFPVTGEGREPIPAEQQKGLVDKIKAFDAVRGWMLERSKLSPEVPRSGKGERLRKQFQGTKASSRRGRSGVPESDEPEAGSDSADGNSASNGDASGDTAH